MDLVSNFVNCTYRPRSANVTLTMIVILIRCLTESSPWCHLRGALSKLENAVTPAAIQAALNGPTRACYRMHSVYQCCTIGPLGVLHAFPCNEVQMPAFSGACSQIRLSALVEGTAVVVV